MYHRNTLILVTMAAYYAVAAYALVAFDAGLLVTATVLFGIPAALFAHFSLAPAVVLLNVSILGVGLGVILEGAAHLFGLWYSLGLTELHIAGLVPLEVVVATTMQVVFFALLYEVLFDDGVYTTTRIGVRLGALFTFALAAIGLVYIHSLTTTRWYMDNAFVWLVLSLIGAAFVSLLVYRQFTVHLLDRLVNFVTVAVIPAGIGLLIGVHNVHKVYALGTGYVGEVQLFGQVVPVEAVVLLFALPFLVALMYELYLDDRA